MADYSKLELLSRRKSGEIWKIRFSGSGEIAALKIMDLPRPGDSAFLLSRSRALLNLRHQHIGSIRDISSRQGKIHIVMDYIEGETLRDIIRRRERSPFSWWVNVFLQCASGLLAAYRRDLIHRDIKPSNIMVGKDGIVKIVDFDLARLFRGEGLREALPKHAFIQGTPAYMSPEQCLGKSVDHRSDIYSLGATLYHCLAGRPPLEAATPSELLEKQKTSPHTPLYLVNPDIPDDLSDLVDKMMDKDISGRFQDYDTLIEALEPIKLGCLSRERGAKKGLSDSLTVHEKAAPHPSPGKKEGGKPSKPAPSLRRIVTGLLLAACIGSLVFLARGERRVKRNRRTLALLVDRMISQPAPAIADPAIRTRNRMKKIADAVIHFQKENGSLPATLDELLSRDYLESTDLQDSWNNPFLWDRAKARILSWGPDGFENTGDDLKLDINEFNELTSPQE